MTELPPPSSKATIGFKLSKASLIASTLCLLIACASIATLVIGFNNSVEMVKWRSYSAKLPWKDEQIQVKHAEAYWLASKNNERMSLRVAYYPEVIIELGDCSSNGIIYLTFYNEQAQVMGQTVNLPYTPNGFLPSSASNFKIDGKRASAHLDGGFKLEGNFRFHCADEQSKLWYVQVNYKPENETHIRSLGRISVELHKN